MKIQVRQIVALALLGFVPFASGADVTGKVILKGTPPGEKVLPLDPSCSRLVKGGEKPTTRFYVTGKDGALADVVVYLKEGVDTSKSYPVPEKPVVLDQVACEYVPYVLAGRTGQKIVVKNSDPVLHNVHPTPTVAGNREYNKAQLPKGPDLDFSWDKPEMFLRFKCDVHPWMFSYVSLFEHPFFAVTKEDGTFTLKDVPPGKYVLEVHHRKAGKSSQEITVGEQGAKATFELDAPK